MSVEKSDNTDTGHYTVQADSPTQAIGIGNVASGFTPEGNFRGGEGRTDEAFQRFYHRFAVIQTLSLPVILRMDFMLRSGVTMHMPSRTVVLGDEPVALEELEGPDVTLPSVNLSCLGVNSPTLSDKVGEASLNNE